MLIIDDEEDFVNALARGLRRQGYAVDVAFDGEQGYELAELSLVCVTVPPARTLPHGSKL